MMFWAHLSTFALIIFGVGIVYLIVQVIRHSTKKIP